MHETQGTTRDRKELIASGTASSFLLIDTGGVDIADPRPDHALRSPSRRAPRSPRPTSCSSSSTRARASRPATRSSRRSCASRRRTCCCSRTRSTTRRRSRSRSSCTASASATRSRSRRCTARTPATCSTRCSTACPASRAASCPTTRRSASRSSAGRTSASRRSSTSCSARSARSCTTCRARRATRSTRSSSTTGRTFILVDTAGLRRKRKQRQGIDYYSELRALDAADRADVALVLIDSSEGIVEGDITAVEVARKSHSATLIVLVEVGHLGDHDRGRPARAAAPAAPAARLHHHLVADGPRASRACSTRSPTCSTLREPRPDRRAEQVPRRAASRRASRRRRACAG